jgi:predicted CXXCH cytochrome family protein
MKRLNPVGSLVGFLFTLLLFLGLGLSLWFNRGLAFSPGKVTSKSANGVVLQGFSSHADFEKQCSYCHEPLKSNIATKCLNCHTDVGIQLKTGQGIHSQLDVVNECASCHPEHRGRNFDPTMASFELFDHTTAGFSLNWHQVSYDTTPMQCTECHKNSNYSIVNNQPCLDCHSGHDKNFAQVHLNDFGSICLGCHDGQDRMINFDHSQTGYALEGKHGGIKCTDCHANENIKATPTVCKDCHTEPTMHQGVLDESCDTCHTPIGWLPAKLNGQSFEHFQTTGFSLALHQADYSKQAIACSSCHPKDLQTTDIQTCIDCHSQNDTAFMTDHQQQFGVDCLVCHDGVDRLSNFDHANFFPLNGKHSDAKCEDCHANQVYRGTPSECSQCHKEPDLHLGVFGLKCYYCHTADAWSPASLIQHNFPLNHGVADQSTQLQCEACHGANYIDYTCYRCHDHQLDEITQSHLVAGIQELELPACAKCHPAGTIIKDFQSP